MRRARGVPLELSGNDAVVVWEDADLETAVAAMCECFYGPSQICMVPKQAIVHPDVADELFAHLLDAVAQIRPHRSRGRDRGHRNDGSRRCNEAHRRHGACPGGTRHRVHASNQRRRGGRCDGYDDRHLPAGTTLVGGGANVSPDLALTIGAPA
jgi:hypothetical protein